MTASQPRLRLAVYDLAPGETALPDRPGTAWFVYVRAGRATVTREGAPVTLQPDAGAFVAGRVSVAAGADVWLYEKTDAAAPYLDAEIVAAHPFVPPFDGPHLVRADRIESEHGAQTPRHGHRGPGLRRLVFGTLRADVGDTVRRIAAGDAWFETGEEPVVGTNCGGSNAAFVRVLVLPADLAGGRSSFVAADATEAARPRAVNQRLFGEVL
ncbi:hypothetical protein N1F89_13235 [Aquibium sp. A9E412]|uniref:hypothetical protein n=1 Tax=Aquibium sp. A9E412 TaxID=2976767 RepID=UPI0025AFB7C0|nr:hypothetical protein [Aquibium sp. A9E412]MDN2567186.1 hypothetical protein [Aquibium sp. A9E412]